jgi:hypothetical protein
MFLSPAFCIHFPLQKITRRTYVLGSIECVQLRAAKSKLKMVLCPESHDEMSPYPSLYCTVHFTVYISLEECLEWRSFARLESRDMSHPLSRGVYGGKELC